MTGRRTPKSLNSYFNTGMRFIIPFKSLQVLPRETKLSTWLYGIATNVARESLRAHARDDQHVDLNEKSIDVGDPGPDLEGQVLSKELNAMIQRSLASLDEEHRLVFTLKVFQQCSYEEISEITGFPTPKLKTIFDRARSEMRQRIRPTQDLYRMK